MPSPPTPLQFSSEEYQRQLQELWERANPFNSSEDTFVNDLKQKPLPPLPTQSLHEEAEMEAVEPFWQPLPTQPPHEEAEKAALLELSESPPVTQHPHEAEKEVLYGPSQSPLPTELPHEETEKEAVLEPFQPSLPTQLQHEAEEKGSPLGVVFPPNLRLDIPAGPHIMNPTSGVPWCPTLDNEQALHDKLIIGVDVQVFLPKVHKEDAPAGALMMDPNIPYPDILKDPVTGILWHPTSGNDHQHKEVIPGANFLPHIYGPLSSRIPVTEPVDYPHVLIHSATGINWVPAPYAYYQWRSTPPQNRPFYASSIARTSSLASTTIALNSAALTSPALSLVSTLSLASTSAITSQPQLPGAWPAYEPSAGRTLSLVSTPAAPSSVRTSSIVRTSSSASTSSSESTNTITREMERERYALTEFTISTAPFHSSKTRLFSHDRPSPSASTSTEPSLASTSMSTIVSQSTSALSTIEPSTAPALSPDLTSTESCLERTSSSATMSTIQREREREFTYDPSLARTLSLASTSTSSSTPAKKKPFAERYVPDRFYRGFKYRHSGSDPKWLTPEERRKKKIPADLK